MRGLLSLVFLFSMVAEVGFAKYGMVTSKFYRTPHAQVNDMNASTRLIYYGGPVISNPRVLTVFWGSSVNGTLQRDLGPFYAATVNSTHMDWLDQYATFGVAVDGRQGTNQHLGRGSYIGEFVINPIHTSKKIDDKDIQAEIEAQVANHVLPAPDNNTVYMVHFPAGITISIEGMKSCANFCAYHNGFQSKAMNSNVFYGVMPDVTAGACSFGCGMSSNGFESTTMVSSHELFEAITDPFPTPGDKPAYPQAWNTTGGEEIADLCSSGAAILKTPTKTYKLSQEWDNSRNACFGGPFESR